MKQKLLVLLLMTAAAIGAQAQSKMVIHQKDGGEVSYGFSEKPVVRYVDDNLNVSTATVSVDYPLAELLKITFIDETTDIGILTDTTPTGDVCIYTLNGVLVKTAAGNGGTAAIDTNGLPSGTYVIKNGKTTYKIMKK